MADKVYYDPLEQMIDEEIERSFLRIPKAKAHFSASMAGRCNRKNILQVLGAKEIAPKADECYSRFIGIALHDAVAKLLANRPEVIASEKFVNQFGSDVVGRIDVLIKDPKTGLNVLYDYKFKTSGGFWKKVRKTKEPDKSHVYQAITYWNINKKYKIDKLRILYISMEKFDKKTFEIDVTQELVEEVKAYYRNLQGVLHYKELPPVQPTPELQAQYFCSNCPYNSLYCFPGSEEEYESVEQNIKDLVWPKTVETHTEDTKDAKT